MKTLRAIAGTTVVFGAVGPAIGAVVIWLQRPPGGFRNVLLLSYVFGGIPALIAGVVYGGPRARGHGPQFPRSTRALLGAGAGLFGCLVFFLFVSAYDLLTVPDRTVGDLDLRFLRRLVAAGIPAGTICALLVGSGRARPDARR
jgi:drug/metabolite transporter (DMT)-like permease